MSLDALFDKARQSGYGYQAPKQERQMLQAALAQERAYFARLRRIAKHLQEIVNEFWDNTAESTFLIKQLAKRYSDYITPWVVAVSKRMHDEVNARDLRSWESYTHNMSSAIQREVKRTPVGDVMRQLLREQVHLIKSIPIDAAERVHELTVRGIAQGLREADIREAVMRTGSVSESRAQLIARTEVARTRSVLTQARAQHIGSTHYVWRTVGDASVRPSHRRLNGQVFAWADAPECDPPHHAHPGQIYNCRCRPVPIIPDMDMQ